MTARRRERTKPLSAKILALDIETQRAVTETFSLWPKYIHIDRVVKPARLLCFAAKWRDEDEVQFEYAWDDDNEADYRQLVTAAWELLDEADFVVTWNGERFDLQWLQAEFVRLGFTPPAPYRSIDLLKVAKKHFGQGLMSLKLDWSARQILGDKKLSHGGSDLWHDIRYGTAAEKLAAQQTMMDYNIHDTELTEALFERFLPWIGENFALFDSDAADGTIRCVKCGSERLQKRGLFPTRSYQYQRYCCNDCGGWSKGRKMLYTTELRPV